MRSNPINIPAPPGATISEQIVLKKMTEEEFCKSIEISKTDYSNLICGKFKITENIALKLEKTLGPPACFWMKLETRYRDRLKYEAKPHTS